MVYDETECRARQLAEAQGVNFDRDTARRNYFLAQADLELAQKHEHEPKDWQIIALAVLLAAGGCWCLWLVATGGGA